VQLYPAYAAEVNILDLVYRRGRDDHRGRPRDSCPETGLEEISCDLPEEDFWTETALL
jgi:hypothetical protein